MTAAQRELLDRIASGKALFWVHPFTPTGDALLDSDTRKRIQDRTVHTCIREGWLKVQVSRDYFQPIALTEKGSRQLQKGRQA
jgi:predicted deacylase